MALPEMIATYVFPVRSYECGPLGTATIATIGNYLQEAASLHAEALGFSRSNFAADGEDISWVLTHLRIQMRRYPRWAEKVSVETFPRSGRRIIAYRDFILKVGEEVIGLATSEWMIINLSTRKLVQLPPIVLAKVADERVPVLGTDPFSKLHWPTGKVLGERTFSARRGDIDLNGHVNNVHYIEWLVETLPETVQMIDDFEITFKSETLFGESIRAESIEVEPMAFAARIVALNGRDHVIAKIHALPGI